MENNNVSMLKTETAAGVRDGTSGRRYKHGNGIASRSNEMSRVRELPEVVSAHRAKRSLYPQHPFEKIADERSIDIDVGGNPAKNRNPEKCTWIFKKGHGCTKLLVKFWYWIDGVRDCAKEYLKISGGRREGDR